MCFETLILPIASLPFPPIALFASCSPLCARLFNSLCKFFSVQADVSWSGHQTSLNWGNNLANRDLLLSSTESPSSNDRHII